MELRIICGKSARMIDLKDTSIEMLTKVLASPGALGDKKRESLIQLSLALTYESMGNAEEATAASKRVRQLSHRDSAEFMQATTIILKNDPAMSEQLKGKLERLERDARKAGYTTVANNAALALVAIADDPEEKIRCTSRVLSGKRDDYNWVRAVAKRVKSLVLEGRQAEVSARDQELLERGYLYAYSQRIDALFDSCHDALHILLQTRENERGLLRLFRYSSFIWRLRGESGRERTLIRELASGVERLVKAIGQFVFDDDLRYFKVRKAAEESET